MLFEHWSGGDAPAIVDDEGVVSGDAMMRIAAGASRLLDSLDIETGSPVPLLMDETRTSLALLIGGALSRRPIAPLGTKLQADELADIVARLRSSHLLMSPERRELGDQVAAAAGVEAVLVDTTPEPVEPLADVCRPDDTIVIVHTSGTTGQPKPIRIVQRPMAHRVDVYREAMQIGPGDRYCSASPFYHTAGVAMDVTVLGMGVAIIPQDWFSVENWRRAGRLGATCTLLVPTMIDMLLAKGALGDAQPRVLQYGAMPIHPETLKMALDVLPDTRMLQIFGQTEASPIARLTHEDHVLAANSRPDLLLSVGRPAMHVELRVEQPDADGIGEIAVRAPHLFQVDADGWRRTGDLGAISDEGYLSLHGRVDDRIIRGGENIYPIEVELVLLEHPQVRECAVIGVPDRRWGEVVKAVVVPQPTGATPDVDELRQLVASRLPHFKVPAEYEFIEELPRNAAGKVVRRQLAGG
jgi:acyl-CoA synthetase (AMP-forming)/AMP-acid ligase II